MHTFERPRVLRLVLSVLAIVFMAETTVMFLLAALDLSWPAWAAALLDSALLTAFATPPIVAFVAWPVWREARIERREIEANALALRTESARQQFEAQLGRALSIAETESDVMDVSRRALLHILPGTRTELLLADSSEAHLRVALRVGADATGACTVESPRRCVAARRGQTLRFPDSDAFDACPHLREREIGACSATCVPMSVMGRVVGVLHTVVELGQPLPDEAEAHLEAIANQVGGRLGMVRTVVSMQVQASTDPLTGLLNRRSFEAACTPILASDRPFALAMADLDHFKRLNDTYGHEAGDRALRAFARVLRTSLRSDDVVGRIGGEEFCIVMPNCSVDAATRALEGVRQALTSAVARSGIPPVTVSIGVVDGRRADDLEAPASLGDKALYEAKRAGRDRIVVSGRGEVSPDASLRQPKEPLLAVVADVQSYSDHA